jgi:uncharacterized sodium:solute symporter family permease YidK
MAFSLSALDIAIIVVSLLAVLALGGFATWFRKCGHFATSLTFVVTRPLQVRYAELITLTSDFFLSDRDMAWWAIGASLFASNIGTEHFVGQAGSAAGTLLSAEKGIGEILQVEFGINWICTHLSSAEGMPVAFYEWSAAYLLLLLGWVFAPVYLRCNLTTVPQYFEQRYEKNIKSHPLSLTSLLFLPLYRNASPSCSSLERLDKDTDSLKIVELIFLIELI